MRSLRFISFLSMLIVVALLLAAPTFAQDISTPEPTFAPTRVVTDAAPPVVEPAPESDAVVPVDLHDLGDTLSVTLIETAWKALQSTGLIVLVVTIVGVLKYVPPIRDLIAAKKLSLNLLVFGVVIVVWLAAGTATWFGYAEQFQGAAEWLVGVIPKTFQFLALIFAAPWLHEIAAASNIPVLGKKVESPADIVALTVTGSSGGTVLNASSVSGEYVTRTEFGDLKASLDRLERALLQG